MQRADSQLAHTDLLMLSLGGDPGIEVISLEVRNRALGFWAWLAYRCGAIGCSSFFMPPFLVSFHDGLLEQRLARLGNRDGVCALLRLDEGEKKIFFLRGTR